MGANILKFNHIVLSVVGDVSVDSETSMVTSQSRKFVSSVFEDAHRVEDLCTSVHRDQCACVVSV